MLVLLAAWLTCGRHVSVGAVCLTEDQRTRLAALVRSDPEAGRLFDKVRRDADACLDDPARPIATIRTAGRLNAEPEKAIVGLIGFLVNDPSLVSQAVGEFKKQIASNLRPDGSSLDFHDRDALHYHCYDIEPLLTLAIAARQNGVDLYSYVASNGASFSNSVRFLVPYCNGTARHAEWVNSKVKFDRIRAEAGEQKFKVGSAFEPRTALRVFELASFFEHGYKPLVAQLAGKSGSRYPTWQSLLNEVCRH